MRDDLLGKLIRRYKDERDRAAVEAAAARRDANSATRTLGTLDGYRNDYRTRGPKAALHGTEPWKLGVHEAFMGRLEQAIGEQQTRVEQFDEQLAAKDDALRARQRRLTAFETLQARRRAAQAAREQAQEQKTNDELASRLAATPSRNPR